MSKMSIEPPRFSFDGKTMGTHWAVLVDDPMASDRTSLQEALQLAVEEVDNQMSTWNPDSDIMRFNTAPLNEWIPLPLNLLKVLTAGLDISHATNGAFEMNIGDVTRAWGFGAAPINLDAIRTASDIVRIRAIDALELDETRSCARKTAALALDLSGIAKGYGVDRLVEVLTKRGIKHALCAIDGEVRALGTQADGCPWSVAIERPDSHERSAYSVLALEDAAVATSGDYRHFVSVKGHRLSHTIDPCRGSPLVNAPASVSVVAQTCMLADAMATALMVMGQDIGLVHADQNAISTLFIIRKDNSLHALGRGLFA